MKTVYEYLVDRKLKKKEIKEYPLYYRGDNYNNVWVRVTGEDDIVKVLNTADRRKNIGEGILNRIILNGEPMDIMVKMRGEKRIAWNLFDKEYNCGIGYYPMEDTINLGDINYKYWVDNGWE